MITHLSPDEIAVELPEGSYGIKITKPVFDISAQMHYFEKFFAHQIALPPGSWSIIWQQGNLLRLKKINHEDNQ